MHGTWLLGVTPFHARMDESEMFGSCYVNFYKTLE